MIVVIYLQTPSENFMGCRGWPSQKSSHKIVWSTLCLRSTLIFRRTNQNLLPVTSWSIDSCCKSLSPALQRPIAAKRGYVPGYVLVIMLSKWLWVRAYCFSLFSGLYGAISKMHQYYRRMIWRNSCWLLTIFSKRNILMSAICNVPLCVTLA